VAIHEGENVLHFSMATSLDELGETIITIKPLTKANETNINKK